MEATVNDNINTENVVEVTNNEATVVSTNKTTKRDLYMIDPRNIVVVEGFNSRVDFDLDELVTSIAESGVKNPISVIPFKDENGNEKYRLVDGERRYRATMQSIENGGDIARIPALFLSKSLKADELLIEQLVRNEGKHFSEYEYGIAFRKFVDLGYEPQEIVKKLGLASWKTIFLTHTERDERVQQLMREGKIEGTEVRRIYQAHKNDEKGAVKEILQGAKKVAETGKKKITVADLEIDGKTLSVKNSAAIKKGITLLFDYYNKYTKNGSIEVDLDLNDLLNKLSGDKNKEVAPMTIDEIFKSMIPQENLADVG